jgi:hypothetical protein
MAYRDRYGARRSSQMRPVRAVITVVCDDTRTAVEYFKLLKHEFKDQKTIHVCPAPHCGANAQDVIERAKEMMPDFEEPGDQTFVLVDVDTNPNERSLRSACNAAGVQLVRSNPCFEVWILAHFEDTGEAFLDCDAVLNRIKAKWKAAFGQEFGRKSQADYAKIMPMRAEALERCRRRSANNSQSWTEVWRVVERIIT